MRFFRAAAVIASVCIALSAVPSVAAADCPEGNFEGDIGGAAVRVFLSGGYPAIERYELLGTFLYTESWSSTDDTFALNGTATEPCSIRFEEVNSHSRETGSWALTFANDRFSGVRTDASGATEVITLRPSMEVDCSGAGPWRTFRSDEWPITFSYPSTWRLSEHDWGFGGDHAFGIELTCPDPARLSSGGFSITLVRGTGIETFETENGRKGERVRFRFFRARGGPWILGREECIEENPTDLLVRGCALARTGRRFGMTVLQGSAGEHRLYRPGGGYVGQGPGILSYLFMLGTDWVKLDSEDPPAWDRDKPGPARFDGDGVTERIVRSIRPR